MVQVAPAVKYDAYAYYGQKLMERHLDKHRKLETTIPARPLAIFGASRGEAETTFVQDSSEVPDEKVGIIGAGMIKMFLFVPCIPRFC